MVCRSVCQSVCHDHEPCEICWTDRDAVWAVDSDGSKKHVLDGVHIVATWWIQLNCPRAAAMRPFCQITLTTCLLSNYYGVVFVFVDLYRWC